MLSSERLTKLNNLRIPWDVIATFHGTSNQHLFIQSVYEIVRVKSNSLCRTAGEREVMELSKIIHILYNSAQLLSVSRKKFHNCPHRVDFYLFQGKIN